MYIPQTTGSALFSQKTVLRGQNTLIFLSQELLAVRGWLTPQNDRKHQVSICFSHNVYTSDYRKCPYELKKRPKGY